MLCLAGDFPSQSLYRRAETSSHCYMYTTLATGFLQRLNRLEILVRDACCAFDTNNSSSWTAIVLEKAFKLRLIRHCGHQTY